ncbi:MAG: N-acetylmuramic acid 6-phosphate etherase [Phycisphaeraceae bacterium]
MEGRSHINDHRSSISASRDHLLTEQRNNSTAAIDALSIEQALRAINTQDMHVPRIVRDAIPAITQLVETIVERMRRGGRLIYLGAGTSGRLGVLDASECPPTFHSDPEQVVGLIAGGDTALRRSSEGKEDEPDGAHADLATLKLTADDTLVGIAAGGTTPYVWGGLAFAREHGCATALLTCVPAKTLMTRERAPVVKANQPVAPPPPPRLPVELDHIIELPVGPEAVTGSTRMKAGTATKLALNMISTTVMIQLGKTWGNLMVDLRATNAKLRDRALRILTQQTDLDRAAAGDLLDAAAGSVKLALVMARLHLDADAARRRLDEAQGHLRPLLGPPGGGI